MLIVRSLGANILVIVGFRLMVALIFAYFIGRILERKYVSITAEGHMDGARS